MGAMCRSRDYYTTAAWRNVQPCSPRDQSQKGFQEQVQYRQPGYFCCFFLISFIINLQMKVYIFKAYNVINVYILY